MKAIIVYTAFLVSIITAVNISCKKERSCENCNDNKPPVAYAGRDTTITSPIDSIELDGTASYDPDGRLTSYTWAKISGPVSSTLATLNSAKTLAKALVAGVYQFQLTVTDDDGLSAKDTVQVIVVNPGAAQPPVACAGPDQSITLPGNTLTLNGSCTVDPNNDITNYLWTKIAGPDAKIAAANAIQTQVTGLVQGVYQFELKVTDAGGMFSKDTIQVTVASVILACGEDRPHINARLTPIGTLSQARGFVSVVSAGNKIFFAGGTISPYPPYASSRVDIYDVATGSWNTAELSVPRWEMGTLAAGGKVFFAGGGYYDDADNEISFDVIDIYDPTNNRWTTASLTGKRHNVAAATVGDKVFFAGGRTGDYLDSVSNKVDIYNLTTNTWSVATMSEPKDALTAVTANNKVYFAGGISGWKQLSNNNFEYIVSNKIEVYDNVTNSWSISRLDESKYHFAGISVGSNIYWAGGLTGDATTAVSCKVEIANLNTRNSTTQYLSSARNFYIDGSQNAVLKDNQIIFFTGERFYSYQNITNKFDIYNISTNSWSLGILPMPLKPTSIISVNNSIYLTDGLQVWKLEL